MNKRISVLVLTTSFPLSISDSSGSFIFEKCKHLVRNGVQVKVISPYQKFSKRKELVEGVLVNRFRYFFPTKWQNVAYGSGIPTNIKNSLLAKVQLPLFLFSFFLSTLKEIKYYDIVHAHWSIAGLIGLIVGKLFRKKIVLMMHGAEVFVLGNNFFLKFILKNTDFIISNSTFTEEKTLELCHIKNHSVIPPGVDINRFYFQNNIPGLRKFLEILEEDILILTIGNFIHRKGFEYLIEAFNIIANQHKITNIKLRIGGRGPLKPKYEKIINYYSLKSFVDFLGYIKNEEISSYYSEADIFVLPSIIDDRGDTEGLGVVLLEANACKTPIIGSKVGGILDVIDDGVNGFFVEQKNARDLAEKIIQLAGDKELRTRIGENGRKMIVSNFNWDDISKKIINIYDTILV